VKGEKRRLHDEKKRLLRGSFHGVTERPDRQGFQTAQHFEPERSVRVRWKGRQQEVRLTGSIEDRRPDLQPVSGGEAMGGASRGGTL